MQEFEDACNKGYLAIRKHSRQLLQLLEMSAFSAGAGTALPCLEGDALEEVKKRLKLTCRSPASTDLLLVSVELQLAWWPRVEHCRCPGEVCEHILGHICNVHCRSRTRKHSRSRTCACAHMHLVLHTRSDRDAELHMRAELQKAKEHFSTGLLDHIHTWTHANV